MNRWKHKKRGTIYEVLTDTASIQCSAAPEVEEIFGEDDWTVYRNVETGAVWIRPSEEFLDGRFEKIAEES